MTTYKDEVIGKLEEFVAKMILENFEMSYENNVVKIFQKIESHKSEIPVGKDHIIASKALISKALLLFSNNKLNNDINVFLKDEKDDIIYSVIMLTWNELASRSKL